MLRERPLVVRPGTRTLAELQAEHEAFCKRVLPERKKTAHGADGRFIKGQSMASQPKLVKAKPERKKKTAHGADGRFIKKEKVDGITT